MPDKEIKIKIKKSEADNIELQSSLNLVFDVLINPEKNKQYFINKIDQRKKRDYNTFNH